MQLNANLFPIHMSAMHPTWVQTCTAPLESAIQEPYPLSFTRMLNSSWSRGIDVVLQEGPYTTYIAEYPGYAKDCQYFSLELSFMNHGFVDSGWLLDSPVHFFLLYFPVGEEGEPPTKLKALLVAKARLLQELSRRGFDRAMLADGMRCSARVICRECSKRPTLESPSSIKQTESGSRCISGSIPAFWSRLPSVISSSRWAMDMRNCRGHGWAVKFRR